MIDDFEDDFDLDGPVDDFDLDELEEEDETPHIVSKEYIEAIEALLPKQALFVEEYLRNGCNGTEAARYAGYNGKDCSLRQASLRLLKKRSVRHAMAMIVKESAKRADVSVESVLQDLELAKSEALIPKLDAQGNWKRDLSNFLAAVKMQGQYVKMFSEKVDLNLSGSVETTHDLSNVPTSILEQMAELYEKAKEQTPSDSE